MKERTRWWDFAACVGTDPDLFYPTRDDSPAEALHICRICQVRTECLSHCLLHGETHGIWGGTTEAERDAIRQAVTECP
ncbi:WhiB family transcriptional regulator [Nonomuraea endophytica]|uniref:WhiB family transcriptional regulator n=1 Tax=Nonomuraea endophytica TaxID=714136 RepID=UPI0037C79F92